MPNAPSVKLKKELEKIIREMKVEKNTAEGREQCVTKSVSDNARKMV